MKKLIPLIFTSVFPSFALAAEALMCRQSYDIFNQQFADQKHFIETQDIAGYLQFNQKITYSALFKGIHADQMYLFGEWKDKTQVEDMVKQVLPRYTLDRRNYRLIHSQYMQPKANFMAEVGELCIVPTVEKLKYDGHVMNVRYDTIFVRNLVTNEWRSFDYSGIETAEDFKLFFPNFPKQIKLAQKKINGLNQAEFYRISHIKKLQQEGEPISTAMQQAIQQKYQQRRQLLKQNGY